MIAGSGSFRGAGRKQPGAPLGNRGKRQHIEAFLGLAREIHEHHAHDKTGVAIAVAGDDHTVAMNSLAGAADEIHGHFSPERKRLFRSELKPVLADANIVCGEGELRSIFLNLCRLENPRSVEFARAHSLDMSNLSYKD